jgi:hypothetical protein
MNQVRRAIVLASVLAATSVAAMTGGVASASTSLSGTYTTTVANAGFLNGSYKISFSPGHFTLHAPYNIVGHGTYSISGSHITIRGPGNECDAAGSYTYTLTRSSLTFHKVNDSCKRAKILTAHALKRV